MLSKQCPICNEQFFNINNLSQSNFNNHKKTCSDICRHKLVSSQVIERNKKRIRVPKIKDFTKLTRICKECKSTFTNIKNKYPSQFNDVFCSDECSRKSISYRQSGEKNTAKIKETREKISLTLTKKHISGEITSMKNTIESNIKVKDNCYDKLFKNKNYIPLCSKDDFHGVRNNEKYLWKCLTCNYEFIDSSIGHHPKCPSCFPNCSARGELEDEVYQWIKSILPTENIIINDRNIIPPFELDIYIPNRSIAIEFNELYWHGEARTGSRDKSYHLRKTNWCKSKGIHLFHIFEDEWIYKKEIVKSIILSKLGIYAIKIGARKCVIKEVPTHDATVFCNENHIQGFVGSRYKYGLYYNNELISVLLLSTNRFKKNTLEITRFCTKLNYQVQGSFSRLFKFFLSQSIPFTEIYSFADRRYFTGDINTTSGFIIKDESKPNYYYFSVKSIRTPLRLSRMSFQKHKLKSKLKMYDPNLTEWELMKLNGYDRIWDCGNYVFVFKIIQAETQS